MSYRPAGPTARERTEEPFRAMSDATVRTLTEDDIEAVADLTARVFADPDERPGVYALTRAAYQSCPYMPLSLCFGAFLGDRLAAKWQVLDFRAHVAGTVQKMAGIQAVVADPELNFRGYPELVAHNGVPTAVAQGFTFALGFAQRGGLYTRVGAVPVEADYELHLDARTIPPLPEAEDPFGPFDEERDLDALLGFYNDENRERSGTLVRTRALWPWILRKPPEIWMSPDGYLGVRVNEASLEVREVAGRDDAFYDRALRKLAAHARTLGMRHLMGHIPPDHPFAEMARRYGAEIRIEVPKRSGCVSLLMDPQGLLDRLAPALAGRLERAGLDTGSLELVFEAPGGPFTLRLCEGATGAGRGLRLAVPAGAILQLCFGFRSVRSIAQEHDLALDPADRRLLEAVFPASHPFTFHTDRY